ncbi:MAG: hypothetical protein RL235_129 [Chlamydiota bacterium]|jgi:ribosomal protein RSM22 (predicted rRNA methylase)
MYRQVTARLSAHYKEAKSSLALFGDTASRKAYLTSRFPATRAAMRSALGRMPRGVRLQSWLDLGAGFGSASWAAIDMFPELAQGQLWELSREAIDEGPSEPRFSWEQVNLEHVKEFPKVDLAMMSYSLGELKNQTRLLERLWASEPAYVVIVEPGTPRGFEVVKEARNTLLKLGASLVAPCPHAMACPMKAGDWCHFSVRLERTREHKHSKGGVLGYEDEKFSYIIAARVCAPIRRDVIIRHPNKQKGHVILQLCTHKGVTEPRTVSKKDKEKYTLAKSAVWGDFIEP